MHRIAMEFIARLWWRRAEVWLIASLLVGGGGIFGFQAAQWSLATAYVKSVDSVRSAYDEALKQRDLRLSTLADKTTKAAEKVEAAANSANKAADTANKAADKAVEAVDRVSQ
jgi:predicted negative regulator of RcsB-dependent stress response